MPNTCQNAATSISSSRLSKTPVLKRNWCALEHSDENEFLKLSKAMCLSTRPCAVIDRDDAHVIDFCTSRAKQPLLGNHPKGDTPSSTPPSHHPVPRYHVCVVCWCGVLLVSCVYGVYVCFVVVLCCVVWCGVCCLLCDVSFFVRLLFFVVLLVLLFSALFRVRVCVCAQATKSSKYFTLIVSEWRTPAHGRH